MKIKAKAIFFDFDNTLGDRYRYAYEALSHLVRTRLPQVPQDSILFEAMVQDLMIFDQFGTIGAVYTFRSFEKKYNVSLGLDDPVAWWYDHQYKFTCLFDDTVSTLEGLKAKGFKLGVITNGHPIPQWGKLRVSGLMPYFDPIIVSHDVGCAKPDRKIFDIARERLGLQPEECVYVGDLFSNDVMGAYNAGYTPVWMYPDEKTRISDFPGIIRIRKLSELLEICECTG